VLTLTPTRTFDPTTSRPVRSLAGMSRVRVRVRRATPDDHAGLVDVLVDCVEGGASVGFMLPFSREEAESFWAGVLADCDGDGDGRIVLVAEDAETNDVVGTVQVLVAMPPNQPHRGEITKMLVLRSARRRGAGEALMRSAQEEAIAAGKTLLTLDTASDAAERLYERLGWKLVGTVPGYALWPQGGPVQTVFFYKELT
jgi:ribosomal protein S18 acetylase RimI-like enzyme